MQRAQRWKEPAHVYLISYEALADDILHGTLDPEDLDFDIAVLDRALLLADFPDPVRGALGHVRARRRWALAGSRPEDPEEWQAIFAFLTGNPAAVRREWRPRGTGQAAETSLLRRKLSLPALPATTCTQAWIAPSRRTCPRAKCWPRSLYPRWLQGETHPSQEALEESYARLADAAALGRAGRLGAKAQAAVDILAEVSAAGHKAIVVTRPDSRGHDRMRSALDPLGVAVLSPLRDADGLREDVETFVQRPSWHVLLADLDTLEKAGSLQGISYLVHFASDWNLARRRRSEAWFLERSGSGHSLCITELFALGTVEERLHRLLEDRGWPLHALSDGASPQDLASVLTTDDWLRRVFEVDITTERHLSAPPAVSRGCCPGPICWGEPQAAAGRAHERMLSGCVTSV
jgi:hypothetical protein